VLQGANPSVQRRSKRAAGTTLQAIEKYLEHARDRQKPRSLRETEHHLRVHAAPLHYERIDAVGRAEIAALLLKISRSSGPIAANRLRAALSAFWVWALRSGLANFDHNPVAFTIRNPEKSRERTLAGPELRAIWAATEDLTPYSRIVRLCLLTGCRREEIGGLRWEEVGTDWIVISAQRMKGKLAHELPLLPMIRAAIPQRPDDGAACAFSSSMHGFSGWSKGKRQLDERLAQLGPSLPRWGLHDLRRTLSTRLHDADVEPWVVEALLAHKLQGVAAVYNRASFREAKIRALVCWHEILAKEVGAINV
jgi:integrase